MADTIHQNSRASFVDRACVLSLADVDANDVGAQRAFASVNNHLRRIASTLDNGKDYSEQEWPNRECLCGRLIVLINRNPDAAAAKLSEAQKRTAVSVLQMVIDDSDEKQSFLAREKLFAEADPQRAEKIAAQEKHVADKRYTAKAAQAAILVAPALIAASGGDIVVPALTALGAYFASRGMRWGGTSLRQVSSVLREYSPTLKREHYHGVRRALAAHTTTMFGGENTYNLRKWLVRYTTMDAQTVNTFLQTAGGVDKMSESLEQLLQRAVHAHVKISRAAQPDINLIVGRVLADFTFGGNVLRSLRNERLHCAFLPCAGVAHIASDGARDAEEFRALKSLFAETYFRPQAPIESIDQLPDDIVGFWRAALANALNPDIVGSVPDKVLFTMYYFVYRYVRKNRYLIEEMQCPIIKNELVRLQRTAAMRSSAVPADLVFNCLFADYSRRFGSEQSWSDWLREKAQMDTF